jgi:CelD/BcsL family acetyltransferase involved in cellulose biosynthesis
MLLWYRSTSTQNDPQKRSHARGPKGEYGPSTGHKGPMRYSVTQESFETLTSYWSDQASGLNWDCLFVLPSWLEAWWREFGENLDLDILAVKKEGELIGMAPLFRVGDVVSLIGNADVCDYLDFIFVPGREREFLGALLDHLSAKGVSRLDLGPLRPESPVLSELMGLARQVGGRASDNVEDVSFEIDLPATWGDYLLMLTGKQRHEIRRKLRRMHEAARVTFRVVDDIDAAGSAMDTFVTLFGKNKAEKAAFMNNRMVSFFRALATSMAQLKLLRICILSVDDTPAAAAMCFDYRSTMYLYNNGYDERFASLSVGQLCKVLSIKDSIQRGRKRFDLLKGDEAYKPRMGGQEIPIHRCQVTLSV